MWVCTVNTYATYTSVEEGGLFTRNTIDFDLKLGK